MSLAAGADDEAFHYYEPENGHRLPHDPFNAIVGPRPIGWISSCDKLGSLNLAPYSFFNGFNYHPPLIGFSSVGWKNSVANVSATGEFVWNLATRDQAEQMNLTSSMVSAEVDEFELAGLEQLPSRRVRAPRVAGSPVAFECVLTQIIRLKRQNGTEIDSWLTIGEVVAAHIDRACLVDGIYNTALARPILRAGGAADYIEVSAEAMFKMPRPDLPANWRPGQPIPAGTGAPLSQRAGS